MNFIQKFDWIGCNNATDTSEKMWRKRSQGEKWEFLHAIHPELAYIDNITITGSIKVTNQNQQYNIILSLFETKLRYKIGMRWQKWSTSNIYFYINECWKDSLDFRFRLLIQIITTFRWIHSQVSCWQQNNEAIDHSELKKLCCRY